jgi:DNA invertase Pin-like site-specific DNA recombinase
MKKAVAYMRTSSATNVGPDKDSESRQRAAIMAYSIRENVEVVDWFYDAAVSGTDPVDTRPGFAAMLQRLMSNGVRTVLVETANRFARDLIVQEMGWKRLQDLGIELIAVDSPTAFLEDTPTAILIRQILGAVAQFDRAMNCAKLASGRARKKAITGKKVEGRKSWVEMNPALVERARALRLTNKLSYPQVAIQLEREGFVGLNGQRLTRQQVSLTLRTT